MKKLSVREITKKLKDTGIYELGSGIFIQSKDSLIVDQMEWADEDECKNLDFSMYEYWVTTDDGADPVGFDTIEEILSTKH